METRNPGWKTTFDKIRQVTGKLEETITTARRFNCFRVSDNLPVPYVSRARLIELRIASVGPTRIRKDFADENLFRRDKREFAIRCRDLVNVRNGNYRVAYT